MLMNSDFILKMSAAMADRLVQERPGKPGEQLRRGWELAFGRPPSDDQLARSQLFLQEQTDVLSGGQAKEDEAHRAALATYCQALFGSTRFLYIE